WRAFKASAEPEMTELRAAGLDDTDIHLRLKAEPSYPGRILDALFTDPARLAEVDAFVQGLVGRLPAPYDALTYGVDVVGLADGSLAFMEGNAGWESQYFYADCDLWVANLMAQ